MTHTIDDKLHLKSYDQDRLYLSVLAFVGGNFMIGLAQIFRREPNGGVPVVFGMGLGLFLIALAVGCIFLKGRVVIHTSTRTVHRFLRAPFLRREWIYPPGTFTEIRLIERTGDSDHPKPNYDLYLVGPKGPRVLCGKFVEEQMREGVRLQRQIAGVLEVRDLGITSS